VTKQAQSIYEFGLFRVDAAKRLLLREGEAVQLTPKCFDILLALVESSGEVVSKDVLMKQVWPNSFVEEGNLTYNISVLRKALGERAGAHQYIVTVPGRGYRFVETVKEQLNGSAGAGATELTRATQIDREKETANEQASVQEPERERLADESIVKTLAEHKRSLIVAAGLLVIAASGISFGLYKLFAGNKPSTAVTEPFQQMKIERLTTTGKATVAAISPDGKYVAHALGGGSRQSLWLRHIATGSDKEIVPTAAVNYTSLTFSPDANYIYFLRTESAEGWNPLYRVPVLGGSIQKLGNDIDSGITFSPDVRHIAYIRGNPERDEAQLLTAKADGSDEQRC
jgi:DNA-binding winged helix-turn-helix (wHTH) protein